jgi:NAD(P)-dependent dehydrogenase (short-subunit alcohol dehydrogenase family)
MEWIIVEVSGKGAVITGAGSGIGAGIAAALVEAGASVVVADIELDKAEAVAGELSRAGGQAFAFKCDVRHYSEVEALADFAWETLGHVEILCNNAGVTPVGPATAATEQDARWIFDVNVFGVWNGMRIFSQRFLEAGSPAWIVNTGSHHSIGAPSKNVALYVSTKHAVLGLSEAFRTEMGDQVGMSVLCPGIINTELWNSGRNRPDEYGGTQLANPGLAEVVRALGFPPRKVGDLVVKGIEAEDFWIWTHPQDIELIEKRYRESVDCLERQWPDGPTELHKLTPSHF